MIDTELLIIFFLLIAAFSLFFILDWTNKSRLKRLQSIIDGRISRTFLRYWFHPCLIGNWHDRIVQVFLQRDLRFTDFFINLYVRCSSPSSTIIILPLERSVSATLPVSTHLKTLLHGYKFRMMTENMLVASNINNEPQVRQFLNSDRLKILKDIFSQGLNYFQIHQDVTSECYIRAGYQHYNYGFSLIFKSKCDFIMNPEVVNFILKKLQDFQTLSLVE